MTFEEWCKYRHINLRYSRIDLFRQCWEDAKKDATEVERERCAKLADRVGYSEEQNAAEVIAHEIRRGT